MVEINTVMEDDTQLGHSSSLHSGQRVARGKHFHGSPAVETTANYCVIEPMNCTLLRRVTYPLVLLVVGFLLLPIPILIVYALYPLYYELSGMTGVGADTLSQHLLAIGWRIAALSLAAFLFAIVAGLLVNGSVPRLLQLLLRKDKVYVLYGVHYFVQQMIAFLTNSVFYNRLFGDSCGVVHWVQVDRLRAEHDRPDRLEFRRGPGPRQPVPL